MTIVGLGAWCDFVTEDEYRQRLVSEGWAVEAVEDLVEEFKQGVSFVVHEFAVLADGRRLTLHEQRGFSGITTSSSGSRPNDQWRSLTLEELERDVRTTVLLDDDRTEDEHPWEWLAGLLHLQGVEAMAEDLRSLPYEVVFSERLLDRVASGTS